MSDEARVQAANRVAAIKLEVDKLGARLQDDVLLPRSQQGITDRSIKAFNHLGRKLDELAAALQPSEEPQQQE